MGGPLLQPEWQQRRFVGQQLTRRVRDKDPPAARVWELGSECFLVTLEE